MYAKSTVLKLEIQYTIKHIFLFEDFSLLGCYSVIW